MPTVRESNGGIEHQQDDRNHFELEEEDDSGSGTGDDQMEDEDDGSSSEMDFEECDRRKTECIDDMTELSQQFCTIKDQFFSERETLIDLKLKDIEEGTDPDYLSRVSHLEEIRKHRHHVAGVLFELRREAIQETFKSEELANLQNMESDKDILYDQQKQELEDKIKRLEEDRHSIDITSDLYESQNQRRKKTTSLI